MDAHKTKIVEKLVKVLCLVLDTPDTKKMNITSMFDEKTSVPTKERREGR